MGSDSPGNVSRRDSARDVFSDCLASFFVSLPVIVEKHALRLARVDVCVYEILSHTDAIKARAQQAPQDMQARPRRARPKVDGKRLGVAFSETRRHVRRILRAPDCGIMRLAAHATFDNIEHCSFRFRDRFVACLLQHFDKLKRDAVIAAAALALEFRTRKISR